VISPGDLYAEVEDNIFDWLEAGTKMVGGRPAQSLGHRVQVPD
jgi:hypothetical protein